MLKIWSQGSTAGDGTDRTDPFNNMQDSIEAFIHLEGVYDFKRSGTSFVSGDDPETDGLWELGSFLTLVIQGKSIP
jgi:hypothetical protein